MNVIVHYSYTKTTFIIMDFIERKIHFFYLEGISEIKEKDYELLSKSFKYIEGLSFDVDGRYQKIDNTSSISTVIYENRRVIRGKIGNRRTNGLPLKESAGKEEPLELAGDESLFEPSHFIIYPPGILAMEFNSFGPRATSIRHYLVEKVPFIDHINVNYIVNDDANGIINSISEVFKIEITALSYGLDRLAKLDESLFQAFKAAHKASVSSEKISIELWSHANNEIGLNNQWWKNIGKWLKVPSNRDIIDKMQLQGNAIGKEKAEYFDVLAEKFVKQKIILKQDENHRVVNSASAFQAINEAFKEVETDIRKIVDA